MHINQKRWFLSLLAGTTYMLSISGGTQVLPVTAQGNLPEGVLSPTDPKAKLDPKLLTVPAIPQPTPSNTGTTLSNSSAALGEAVGHDPTTGTTQVILNNSPQTSNLSTSLRSSQPNYGARAPLGSESNSGGAIPNSVIGTDNRILVTDTTVYPWRTQTKLYVTFPNGKTYGCSGTLIEAKYLLTAGHCVYSKTDGGWYKKLEAIPGLNGTYKPYGSVFGKYVRSYKGWTNSENSNYDLALVTLDKSIGNTTGWLGHTYYSTVNGLTSYIAGYPGDKSNGLKLYYDHGSITSSTAQRLYYTIDTYSGQSGSGVYRILNSKRYVFAVHTTGGSTTNSGTRIDSKKFDNLKSWIASGK